MKKSRKKTPHLSTEELLNTSPWQHVIRTFPDSSHRLAIRAFDAYDRGDLKSMEPIANQCLQLEAANEMSVLRTSLADLLVERGKYEEAVDLIADAILWEEDNPGYPATDAVGDITALSQEERVEAYVLMIGAIYTDVSRYKAAVDWYGRVWPFKRSVPDSYRRYLVALTQLYGKTEDAAEEVELEERYVTVAEKILELYGREDSPEAVHAVMAAQAVFLDRWLQSVGAGEREDAITPLISYISSLPPEVRHNEEFQDDMASIMVYLGEHFVEEARDKTPAAPYYRYSLEQTLEISEQLNLFPEARFRYFLISGYRAIQEVDFLNDKTLPYILRSLIADLSWSSRERNDDDHEKSRHARMNILISEHHLLRWCQDEPGRVEEVERAFDYVAAHYPLMMEKVTPLQIPNDPEVVEGMIGSRLEAVWKGRRKKSVTREVSGQAVEDSYQEELRLARERDMADNMDGGEK